MNKREQLNELLNRPATRTEPRPESRTETRIENATMTDCEVPTSANSARPENNANFRHLKFDDIQSSFKPYDGKTNIENWIQNFCQQCEIFDLNELEKFVFAKKLLVDIAALWARFESIAINFNELISEMREEFQKTINSATIHEKLRQRKKRRDESSLEYLYHMLEIAAQSDIDVKAIITYVIQGLPGSTSMKNFMHDADNLKQFKRKLESYDNLQVDYYDMTNKQEKSNFRVHCINCGQQHDTTTCPHREKGPKCFNCNEFGHLSKSCLVKPRDDKAKQMPRICSISTASTSEEVQDEEVKNSDSRHHHHDQPIRKMSLIQKIDQALLDYEQSKN